MAYPTGVNFKHTGPAMGLQPINETSTTQKHRLGMLATASDETYGEGQFIYLKGVATTAKGDLVVYDTKNGTTVRAVSAGATSTGPAAIAMSANIASQYGWYQIGGAGPVLAGSVAANAPCYLTSTASQIDDTVIVGSKIDGLITRSTTTADYCTVQIDRPSITGESNTATVATLVTDLDTAEAAIDTLEANRKITLSAGAEALDVITVTGAVVDLNGAAIASAVQVLVRTLAVTDDKGDIAVTVGTAKEIVNAPTGENYAWIETTAAGLFTFTVTNDTVAGEETVVHASTAGALTQTIKLTFAA